MEKKILLTGIKPTGKAHLGNYFGMMKQVVDLQKDYKIFLFIPNYHALNIINSAEDLSKNTKELILDLLSIGIEKDNIHMFMQSDTPQVAELMCILNTITTVPYLQRAHAYKDAVAKKKEINVGTFVYPVLMAADILIQDTDVVPVGKDQKQHVEMARDIAEKFNRIYGETFKLPEAIIKEEVAVVPGLDGQKMSKSYGNTIPLFASSEEIKSLVMSIPTDSKGVDEPKNADESIIFNIYKLFASDEEIGSLRKRFENGGMGYKEAKDILIEKIDGFISPMREKRESLKNNPEIIEAVLREGREVARERAEKKMADIRRKVGLDF